MNVENGQLSDEGGKFWNLYVSGELGQWLSRKEDWFLLGSLSWLYLP